MRQQWTTNQLRMAVAGAEQRLEQVIAASRAQDPLRKTIPGASCAVVHDAVVSLVTLFRDHVTGSADVARLIAREYAKCVDGTLATPALACIEHILDIVRTARERHLPAGDGAAR